jgi:hypothetical protein
MADSLGYLHVAVWANPGFVIIGIGTNAGLGCIRNSTLDFFAPDSHAHCRKI